MEKVEKRSVCVTGGTGFVASWTIKRLLEDGYAVNTTVRSSPGSKKDVSFLTSLPGANERLKIYDADLSKPESFEAPIKGCIGVFHIAHPMDLEGKEPEKVQTERVIKGTIGILQACLDSNTVKRVVYTSSASTVMFTGKMDIEVLDEESWSDVEFIKANITLGAPYIISKTLTEKAALDFAVKNGLDLVTVLPTYIHGPFVCPRCPGSVRSSMAMIFGDRDQYKHLMKTAFVHVDDVASAHMFLLDYPHAKGRYICSALEVKIDELYDFLSTNYPEYQIPNIHFLKDIKAPGLPSLSSKKLVATGFKFKYGLKDMFDGAIDSLKRNKIL